MNKTNERGRQYILSTDEGASGPLLTIGQSNTALSQNEIGEYWTPAQAQEKGNVRNNPEKMISLTLVPPALMEESDERKLTTSNPPNTTG